MNRIEFPGSKNVYLTTDIQTDERGQGDFFHILDYITLGKRGHLRKGDHIWCRLLGNDTDAVKITPVTDDNIGDIALESL